jgi:hypothetical protein
VTLSEDLQTWLDLQRETLARVHTSWLPGIPVELLTVARKSALGRRWLTKRLAAVSPLLFGRPGPPDSVSASGLVSAAWLMPVLRDSLECALDLGSLALASTVRTIIKRSAVVKLRAALGPDRYIRALTSAPVPSQTTKQQVPPATLTDTDENEIVERLTRCGAVELAAYAEYLHPAWGESVRLTFERGWWRNLLVPQLIPEVAEAALRLREPPPAV